MNCRFEVKAEVTGTVWKVLARVGESVDEGAELLILESMKMEVPVVAPERGKVKEVLVVEGASVEEGQLVAILVSIEESQQR